MFLIVESLFQQKMKLGNISILQYLRQLYNVNHKTTSQTTDLYIQNGEKNYGWIKNGNL